jgi:hypothetical protein
VTSEVLVVVQRRPEVEDQRPPGPVMLMINPDRARSAVERLLVSAAVSVRPPLSTHDEGSVERSTYPWQAGEQPNRITVTRLGSLDLL